LSSRAEPNPGRIWFKDYAGGKAFRHFILGHDVGMPTDQWQKVLLRIVTFEVQLSGKKDNYRIKNQYFLEA
jgi:hypothetical protein